MDIVQKKIAELQPYEFNPKEHSKEQVAGIVQSIKNFGFLVPLVVSKDGEIAAGHGRLLAAQQLEMEEVPCVLADNLTDKQIRAFRIVDNKAAESEWIFDLLGKELSDLSLLSRSATGFSSEEIQSIADSHDSLTFLDGLLVESTKDPPHEDDFRRRLIKIGFVCTKSQKATIMEAINSIKTSNRLLAPVRALAEIAEWYLKKYKAEKNGRNTKEN